MKWIFFTFLLLFTGCVGCSMFGPSDSDLVEDMAEECRFSMQSSTVKTDGKEKETNVICMRPGYGL